MSHSPKLRGVRSVDLVISARSHGGETGKGQKRLAAAHAHIGCDQLAHRHYRACLKVRCSSVSTHLRLPTVSGGPGASQLGVDSNNFGLTGTTWVPLGMSHRWHSPCNWWGFLPLTQGAWRFGLMFPFRGRGRATWRFRPNARSDPALYARAGAEMNSDDLCQHHAIMTNYRKRFSSVDQGWNLQACLKRSGAGAAGALSLPGSTGLDRWIRIKPQLDHVAVSSGRA